MSSNRDWRQLGRPDCMRFASFFWKPWILDFSGTVFDLLRSLLEVQVSYCRAHKNNWPHWLQTNSNVISHYELCLESPPIISCPGKLLEINIAFFSVNRIGWQAILGKLYWPACPLCPYPCWNVKLALPFRSTAVASSTSYCCCCYYS